MGLQRAERRLLIAAVADHALGEGRIGQLPGLRQG